MQCAALQQTLPASAALQSASRPARATQAAAAASACFDPGRQPGRLRWRRCCGEGQAGEKGASMIDQDSRKLRQRQQRQRQQPGSPAGAGAVAAAAASAATAAGAAAAAGAATAAAGAAHNGGSSTSAPRLCGRRPRQGVHALASQRVLRRANTTRRRPREAGEATRLCAVCAACGRACPPGLLQPPPWFKAMQRPLPHLQHAHELVVEQWVGGDSAHNFIPLGRAAAGGGGGGVPLLLPVRLSLASVAAVGMGAGL